jgi:hypothetical protein
VVSPWPASPFNPPSSRERQQNGPRERPAAWRLNDTSVQAFRCDYQTIQAVEAPGPIADGPRSGQPGRTEAEIGFALRTAKATKRPEASRNAKRWTALAESRTRKAIKPAHCAYVKARRSGICFRSAGPMIGLPQFAIATYRNGDWLAAWVRYRSPTPVSFTRRLRKSLGY